MEWHPPTTPWCSSYWKASQLICIYTHTHIHPYTCIVTLPCAPWACRVLFIPSKSTSKCRAQMLAVVCQMLLNVTDIINFLVEPHFKATRWVIGELLKVNTAKWLAFILKYKVFDEYNSSTTKKRTLNCRD